MNVLIPTVGTRGDVQPYIALAPGLQAAGHQVTLASHPAMKSLAASYGVRFQPIGPDVDMGRVAAGLRGRSGNWLLGLLRVMRLPYPSSSRPLQTCCPSAARQTGWWWRTASSVPRKRTYWASPR